MSANRFLLSLVAVLLLNALGSADSINVTAGSLHSRVNTYAGHSAIQDEKAAPTVFLEYNNHISPSENGNGGIGAVLSGMGGKDITSSQTGRIVLPERKYGPTCCAAQRGIGTGQGPALSTPEPGSLMLLSTGLIGIAGMLRRKLRPV